MNAPTGRNARVTVIERAIAASDLPKSFAMAVSVMTTRKKSKASSIQPRKPAATVAFRSLGVAGGVVMVLAPSFFFMFERAVSLRAGYAGHPDVTARIGRPEARIPPRACGGGTV